MAFWTYEVRTAPDILGDLAISQSIPKETIKLRSQSVPLRPPERFLGSDSDSISQTIPIKKRSGVGFGINFWFGGTSLVRNRTP